MRSVVVVLPASIWAMIPMLRVFSSEYCRSTSASLPPYDSLHEKRGVRLRPPLHFVLWLPAIMRERLVGLRHLVRVFSLLHGGAPGALPRPANPRPPSRPASLAPAARGGREPPPPRPSSVSCSASAFLPQFIMMSTTFPPSRLPSFGSASTPRLAAPPRRMSYLAAPFVALAPSFERLCFRPATPAVSSVPRMM